MARTNLYILHLTEVPCVCARVQFSGSETLSFICEQSSFLAANNANANECRMQMKCNQFVYFSYAYLGFCIGTKQAKLQKFQPFHLRFPRSLGAFEYLNSIRRKTAGWKAGWRAAPHFIVECPVSKVGCPKSDGPCFWDRVPLAATRVCITF